MKRIRLVILLLLFTSLVGNAQTQLWDSISEGQWEITHYHQTGNIIVMAMVVDNAAKQVVVDKKARSEPLFFWDLAGDTFLKMKSNWPGGPTQMNPMRVWVYDSSRLFITDGVKIVRADIDFQHKTITYEQTFQGSQGVNLIRDMFIDKTNGKIYFISSTTKHYLYISNMLGEIQNTVQFADQAINIVKSIVEWQDTIYFGYTYDGGLPDGSGFAKLDPTTGQITKIFNQPWKDNRNGCYISIVGGKFYLETDPGLYHFEPSLFEYKNGSWITKIVGGLLPEEKNGRSTVWVRPEGHLPTGDTINKTKGGINYDFTNGVVGKAIPNDPRLDIQFSEKFKTSFSQRHNQNMPEISFIYELSGKIIGFGPNIVAELIDTNASGIKTPKEKVTLNLYPNPATGKTVYIQGLQKPTEYTITNTTGQLVTNGTTSGEIDVSAAKPGVYLLTLPSMGAHARWVKSW